MADKGNGITVTFDSSFLADVTSITWSGIAREAVNTTTYATTTAMTYEPADIFDPGELQFEALFDPSDEPAWDGAAETVTVNWTDSGSATWAASGFLTGFEIQGGDGIDRVRCSGTIKLSGDITVTP